MEKVKINIKPYSSKQLSVMYGVSPRTFRRWIGRFKDQIGERQGHFYMIPQVEIIFDKLGIPHIIELN